VLYEYFALAFRGYVRFELHEHAFRIEPCPARPMSDRIGLAVRCRSRGGHAACGNGDDEKRRRHQDERPPESKVPPH
jgi:hypothetical protein